jgi:hypothetical protein
MLPKRGEVCVNLHTIAAVFDSGYAFLCGVDGLGIQLAWDLRGPRSIMVN